MDRLFWLNMILYLENCAGLILLPVDHIENDFGIFLWCLAMESWTIASFSWQGRKVYELAAHISGRNHRGK